MIKCPIVLNAPVNSNACDQSQPQTPQRHKQYQIPSLTVQSRYHHWLSNQNPVTITDCAIQILTELKYPFNQFRKKVRYVYWQLFSIRRHDKRFEWLWSPGLMNLIVLCSTMMNAPKLARVRFQVRRSWTVLLFTFHPTCCESDWTNQRAPWKFDLVHSVSLTDWIASKHKKSTELIEQGSMSSYYWDKE